MMAGGGGGKRAGVHAPALQLATSRKYRVHATPQMPADAWQQPLPEHELDLHIFGSLLGSVQHPLLFAPPCEHRLWQAFALLRVRACSQPILHDFIWKLRLPVFARPSTGKPVRPKSGEWNR